ncbi:caspase family protein, partial [Nocardia sp. NPDC057663]|uniref:caspase, EACC1-associated type n=1 Tax=Nocardia sp. NPDC057663 TaxID=3346201 RepID=UPI00366C63AD
MGSRAVLIGTATYTHPDLTAIPAAANNLLDLQRTLTSAAGGAFDPERCTVLTDPQSGSQIGDAIALAAGEATGVLLVYYTGHGILDNRGRLHLAVSGTDPTRPAWTSVSFQTLREEILESPAEARILILDCCFSGRAFEAMADTATVIAAETSIRGTYTITSSAANATSFAPVGDRNTAFTSALLATADNLDLTLDELYRGTEQHLIQHGHPRPGRRAVDTAGELKLFGSIGDPRSHHATDGPYSTYNLGWLAHQSGDLPQAEDLYRHAAEAGHAAAMYQLGVSREKSCEFTDAEIWYRRAADAGHPGAMDNLRVLSKKSGERTVVEVRQPPRQKPATPWWRRRSTAAAIAVVLLALGVGVTVAYIIWPQPDIWIAEKTLKIAKPGGTEELSFAGTKGQKVFVEVASTNLPDHCFPLSLRDPVGKEIAEGCISDGGGSIDTTALPASGEYAVRLEPSNDRVGEATVRVIDVVDQNATISPDGTPVTSRIDTPG